MCEVCSPHYGLVGCIGYAGSQDSGSAKFGVQCILLKRKKAWYEKVVRFISLEDDDDNADELLMLGLLDSDVSCSDVPINH